MSPQMCFILAGILGALGVVTGAFGAHGLNDEKNQAKLGWEAEDVPKKLATYEVAVRYQMYHALALGLVGLLTLHLPSRWTAIAGVAFLIGILIFSGMLYALVFSGVKILGAIVPIGGVAFIVGWICLAIAGATLPSKSW